jgi:hypothetical protein
VGEAGGLVLLIQKTMIDDRRQKLALPTTAATQHNRWYRQSKHM